MSLPPPRRFVHIAEARAKFGDSIDTLSQLLFAGDPLADDVVEAFSKLPTGAGQSAHVGVEGGQELVDGERHIARGCLPTRT